MSSSVSVITPPTQPYWKTSSFGLQRIVSITRSPFTGKQQVHDFGGAYWQGSVTLPPMNRALAAPWTAFLSAMKGTRNVFLLGDPDARSPLGSVSGDITAANNGTYTGEVGGSALRIQGLTPSVAAVFKAGDYFQTGSGATANLYIITEDIDSDENGNAVLLFEPTLRRAVTNTSPIIYQNAACPMRMGAEDISWDVDQRGIYTIGFDVIEAF